MRFFPFFVASVLGALLVPTKSHAVPTTSIEILSRQVRQMTQFDLSQISPDEPWCVVKFAPREPGKTVVVQPSRLNKKTLEITPTGPPQGPFVSGTYSVLESLTPKSSRTGGNYKWKEPKDVAIFSGPVDLARQDRLNYSLFIDGGIAVCKIDLQARGEKQFTPNSPIPQAWQRDVAPAYAYYKTNRDVFDPSKIFEHQSQLRGLLEAKNPFIALAAGRVLARTGNLDAAIVRGPLASVKGLRQAALIALILRQKTSPTPYGVLDAQTKLSDEADSLVQQQSVSGLKNLTLGIYAAGVTTTVDPFNRKIPFEGFGPAVLRAVAQRAQKLKFTQPSSEDKRELLALLHQLGLVTSSS